MAAAGLLKTNRPALGTFVQRLRGYGHGVVAIGSEGIDNALKVIERRAYGHHDQEHFFLKKPLGLVRHAAKNQKKPRIAAGLFDTATCSG